MSTKIFRIGSIFLLISAVSFGWISLGQKSETKFWNIGTYSIASVSARDDEWEEEDEENEEDSRDSRKRDNDDDEYIIQDNSPVDPTPIDTTPVIVTKKVAAPISSTPTEPCVAKTIIAPISLEKKIVQKLGGLGFDAENRQNLQSQFQGLYSDISLKYPTSSGRIEVLQQLSRQAESKINELRSLPKVDSSTIFTTKIQSLQALRALSDLQIEAISPPLAVETDIPCPSSSTSPTVAVPAPVAVKKVTTPTTAKTTPVAPKPVTPTPAKVAPVPVKVAPKPVVPAVNTRTTAS